MMSDIRNDVLVQSLVESFFSCHPLEQQRTTATVGGMPPAKRTGSLIPLAQRCLFYLLSALQNIWTVALPVDLLVADSRDCTWRHLQTNACSFTELWTPPVVFSRKKYKLCLPLCQAIRCIYKLTVLQGSNLLYL